MTSKKMFLGLLLTLVLALVVSACGQPSLSQAKQNLCDAVQRVNDATEKLKNVDANTSVDELKATTKELEDAWKELAEASKVLKNVQLSTSEDAYKTIVDTVDKTISGDTTLGDSAATIAAGAAQLNSTLKIINTTICKVK